MPLWRVQRVQFPSLRWQRQDFEEKGEPDE